MSHIMEKFDVLNELNEEFKQRVKILYVFEDYEYIENMNKYVLRGYNVLMVTKDDKTYAFGNNTYNQLGFGHNRVVKEIQIVNELCDQQIIDFANDLHLCIARNSFGKIYCWGFNRLGFLGIGSENNIYQRPILNHYLNNEFIIDISCGDHYSLALTNFGEVYAWGWNKFGQIGNGCNVNQLIPIKLKSFNNERVVMISSGSCHSMALTECGHVYSWGNNKYGQLGIGNTLNSNEPKFVAVIDENKCNVSIKKISCGISHSFLLSRDGYIYWFGSNPFRELGNQKDENDLTPCKIKTETQFINISSHWTFNNEISLVLSQKGDLFYFFECKERTTRKLKSIKLESFVEFYAKYLNITHKAFNFEEQNSISIILRNKYVNEFTEQSLISFKNFSVISKVMHKSSKRNYVIKRIAINKEESNKAFKELNLMRKLKSIYIFEYIDSWIEENFIEKTYGLNILHPIFDPRNKLLLHIQMELCCETLDEVMKQLSNELMENNSEMIKTLYYYICCELFTEIIECIHYLHERNIIHRDLKPSNIMITDGINGRFIKLSDFGLSVVHDFYKQSIPQNLKSSKYMAPELSQNKKYDLKVDIYSLGIIANELFFFNSNLFSNSIEIISNDKLPNLQSMCREMIETNQKLRPTCGQMLEKKNNWYLSPSSFPEKFSLKETFNLCLKIKSLRKSFCFHFMKRKFKNDFKKELSTGFGEYNKTFEEMDLISIGSYGIVCNAMDRKNYDLFAIKKIPFDERIKDSVMKEIQILQKLESDLVVRLESVWIEDNYLKIDDYKNYSNFNSTLEVFKPNKSLLLHIQMELCLMTLRDVMKRLENELNQNPNEVMTPLGYYISSELFKEILESVDYLHKLKVIHRDLKPNNILITDGMNGRFVKIADFGIATIHEFDGQSHTKYKGTQRYAAPEVMISRKYDMKADIYSLGVILQDLFNIDINELIGEGSQLENKYSNLFGLAERMIAPQKILRPNCENILSEKELWSLDLSALKNSYKLKPKKMKYSDEVFHSHFVEMKSRSPQ